MAIKILLDPGHDKAKYNQGVVPEYWEGARMWRLYQLLRPALEKRGFIVGGTKTRCDQALTVTQRGAMARGYHALISLHSNACGTESVDRPVFIHFVDDDCGKIDDTSKDLAKCLAKVVAEVMGTSQPQQYSKLSVRDRDHDGQKNDDHYGVLFAAHQAGVPAVIVEHSFHTNRRAAQWLLSDDNLAKLAEAEADALAEYYGVTGSTGSSAGSSAEAPAAKPGKTIDAVAKEVIAGKWGVGADRKAKLTAAGYDYAAVQKRVNEILSGKAAKPGKTVDQLAREVIAGKWGNGADRKARLTAAGYDYAAVQKRVNELL